MEQSVELLEAFFNELNIYCAAVMQTDNWYDTMRSKMIKEQERKRIRNAEDYTKQQVSFRAVQEKTIKEREAYKEKLREQIVRKRELMNKSIMDNCAMRNRILARRDEINRPEFFRYAYRYREYGDFYPKVTSLEDYSKVDLDAMIKKINGDRTGLLMSHIKALMKSEDIMLEYAAFANLIGKAHYICEVDNDALRAKGHEEIIDLEKELAEADEKFRSRVAEEAGWKQKADVENENYQKMFEQACEEELLYLQGEYQNRLMQNYEALKQSLQEHCTSEQMQSAYAAFQEAADTKRQFICADGVPLQAKLGKLWFEGTELLNNAYVRQVMETEYPFMLQGERFSIPGIA